MFTFPPAGSKAHCGWCGQQAALGWEISRVIFGEKMLWTGEEMERGDEVVDAGDTSLQPAYLGRHKCVSLRVRWLSWHYKQRNHTRLPQQHHQLGHGVLSPSNQQGVPRDSGVPALLPWGRMRVPPSPWDWWMLSFFPWAGLCVVPLP